MNVGYLVEWLKKHSDSVSEGESEIVFTHFTGETSVLIRKDVSRHDYIPTRSGFLTSFYGAFQGASIGNGHIVIATNVRGGVSASHGFSITDLLEAKSKANSFGMQCKDEEEVFMQTAGWMFLYAIDPLASGGDVIRMYDRDFQKSRTCSGLGDVLEEWWSIVLEDR